MAYWLIKTEPSTWSWDDQLAATGKKTHWDGVRNHVAKQHLQAMKKGDRCFFYHSVKEKRIVGVVEVVKPAYPDPSDEKGTFVMVDVKAIEPMPNPVELATIKAEPRLKDMVLVNNSRLSVQPVTPAEWKTICKMGGI